MNGYIPPIDALVDELLAAIRDHPEVNLDPANGPASARLCAAYNRLYCELHDKEPPSLSLLKEGEEPSAAPQPQPDGASGPVSAQGSGSPSLSRGGGGGQ